MTRRQALAAALVGATAALFTGVYPAQAALPTFEPLLCARGTPAAKGDAMLAWHVQRLNLDQAWRIATGKGIRVAVLDTGAALDSSPYFTPERYENYNFAPIDENQARDRLVDCTHGTEVSGIIAAARGGDNRTAFAGVAPDATIVSMRTLTATQGSDESLQPIIAALNAIATNPALKIDVVNISQFATQNNPDYKKAIDAVLAKGIPVIASAGNKPSDFNYQTPYPAAWPGVISVGMSQPDDAPFAESYFAKDLKVTVGAPGVNMTSLLPSPVKKATASKEELVANQSYIGWTRDDTTKPSLTGTSFATPIVTGVVALMLEHDKAQNGGKKTLTPAQIEQRLIETADPTLASPPDKQVGYGIVNPVRALTGVPLKPAVGGPQAAQQTPVEMPDPPKRDSTMVAIAMSTAIGATVLAVGGWGLSVAIPAARRRGSRPATPGTKPPTG